MAILQLRYVVRFIGEVWLGPNTKLMVSFINKGKCELSLSYPPPPNNNLTALTAVVSQRCMTDTAIIRQTIQTTVGPHHQPGQRASARFENPSLRALGAMSQQEQLPSVFNK